MPRVSATAELVEMIRQRKVIPFVGAGFSASLGLPSWDSLLNRIAGETNTGLAFSDIKSHCSSDPLQMAEFFFIANDRSIGPLRHVMSRALAIEGSPVRSGAHVDLVNLGASQVYTTNYDDAVELTYKALSEPVDVIALPKHVATLDSQRTQVVKFHGDLRHDQTLVLTESSYYARLDFESPMDLKFRSDILGKSVLFMGYGFADINIRIIWFKLMRMMKDIHPDDRPKSYIVTFGKNPVRETLYEEVGIKTIVLDPKGEAQSAESKTRLLADFLNDLALQCSSDGLIPGQRRAQFVSATLVERTIELGNSIADDTYGFGHEYMQLSSLADAIAIRRIPPELFERVAEIAGIIGSTMRKQGFMHHVPSFARFAMSYIAQIGNRPDIAGIITLALGLGQGRSVLYSSDMARKKPVNWKSVWTTGITAAAADVLLQFTKGEINAHKQGTRDSDLAYLSTVVARIVRGELSVHGGEFSDESRELMATIEEIYPPVGALVRSEQLDENPASNAKPIIDAIDQAKSARVGRRQAAPPPGEDIPF